MGKAAESRLRQVKVKSLEEKEVARAIGKALARADGGVNMCIVTQPGAAIPEHLEVLGPVTGLGSYIEAWATGEVSQGRVTGLMCHKDDPRKQSEVDIPLGEIVSMHLAYMETPGAIHPKRLAKETYTSEEIAAALGVTVAEVERRAQEEGWPYLEN